MTKVKEVTIYDLARKLNISIATVSRALKDDPAVSRHTRKKIADLAEELGYRTNNFARNLRNQHTKTIGVIVPRLNSYFMSTVIAGIEKVVNREDYNLIIIQSSESATKEVASAKTMFNNRVDGLLVSLSYDTGDLVHFEQFSKKNIPVIFFDRCEEQQLFTNVVIDNRKASYEATQHLIEQGYKRIAHVTAPSERKVYTDRVLGYKQALAEHHIPFKEENLLTSNLSLETGAEVVSAILKMPRRPDAIFVANDNCAVGCMMALKHAGIRIPDEMGVIGFNNDPVSKVIEPNLTTINYPGFEMGEVAAFNLINHLKGGTPGNATNTILLRSELVIRSSSLKNKTTSALR
ncbi:MAG: LacI family DNA-binding transcriptional regulator [Sediminibacterium sp.]